MGLTSMIKGGKVMLQVDWSKKKIIKKGLARGTRYALISIWPTGERYFYGWLTRKEINIIKLDEKVIEVN